MDHRISRANGGPFSQLLDGPAPPSCTARPIDFAKAGLTEYANSFAITISDLLTAEECAEFLVVAQASCDHRWEQALLNIGNGQQALAVEARNCGRVIFDTLEFAAKLAKRLLPFLPEEIVSLRECAHITGNGPVKRKETWRISRFNERLRFLKYTPGMYFREHCDGNYVTPDGKEISFLTVHLYLNGNAANTVDEASETGTVALDPDENNGPLVGGATRYFSWNMKQYLDVAPSTGSCVVFQQRNLLHSGEDVVQGTKYTMRTDVMYTKAD